MSDFAERFKDNFSTAMLVDAAFRTSTAFGLPNPGIVPLDSSQKLAGPIVTVKTTNDIVAVMDGISLVAQAGDVVVITNSNSNVGVVGDILATEAQRKGLAGIVVYGCVRDSRDIIAMGLPVFCCNSTPLGPLKQPQAQQGIGQVQVDLDVDGVLVKAGDWVFGDADGVVFLKAADLATVFAQAAISQAREDAIVAEIRAGKSLADVFQLEAFLTEREANPAASFNQHLKNIGRVL